MNAERVVYDALFRAEKRPDRDIAKWDARMQAWFRRGVKEFHAREGVSERHLVEASIEPFLKPSLQAPGYPWVVHVVLVYDLGRVN